MASIVGPRGRIVTIYDTSYTLRDSDNGNTLCFENAAAITVTIPLSLQIGWSARIVQQGAGAVTLSGQTGVTLNNLNSSSEINGQWSEARLTAINQNVFVLSTDVPANPWVVVLGLVGDGVADDGPAIQAVIDANPGRTIALPNPSVSYKITAPLTIESASTYLVGENRTKTKIVNAGAGDALVIGPADPAAGVLQGGNGVRDLTITRVSNIATGVALKIQVCTRCNVNNVQVLEHFNNLHLIACNTCQYTNLTVGGGSVFAGAAGSAGLRISSQSLTAGGILRSQVQEFGFFTVGGGDDIWDDCVLIESGDTAFFTNGYVAYPLNNLFHIKAPDASSPIVSVNLSQVYLDGVATGTSRIGVRIESDGQGTSSPSFITLSDCTVGQLGQGVVSDEPGLGRLLIGGVTEFHNIEHEAIKVSGATGDDIHIAGALFYNCGRQNADNIIDINSANSVNISANLGNAGSFTSNTFLKLAGTIGSANLGPNVTKGFSADYDIGTATITEVEAYGMRGSFTPSLAFDTPGTSSFTTSTATGKWEWVGKLVHYHIEIVTTPTIGTGAGALRIGNLPFTAPNTTNNSGGTVQSISANFTWPAGTTSIVCEQIANGTYIRVLGNGSGISRAAVGASNMTNAVSHTLNLQCQTNMAG